jgi:hypothetical protein
MKGMRSWKGERRIRKQEIQGAGAEPPALPRHMQRMESGLKVQIYFLDALVLSSKSPVCGEPVSDIDTS